MITNKIWNLTNRVHLTLTEWKTIPSAELRILVKTREKILKKRKKPGKNWLLLVIDILEKYGIYSSTDVSEFMQHDFIQLESRGLKPFQLNKVKRWCESVPPALTSSVTLTVGDVNNEEDGTESDSDDSVSNDSGERDSEKDCVVIGGKETATSHEEAGNTRGKRVATGGTHCSSSKHRRKNLRAS